MSAKVVSFGVPNVTRADTTSEVTRGQGDVEGHVIKALGVDVEFSLLGQ
jgi:hypothetical protein